MKDFFKKTHFTNRIIWIVAVFLFFGTLVSGIVMILGDAIFRKLIYPYASPSVHFITEYYLLTIFSVLVFVLLCLIVRKNRFILESVLPKNNKNYLSKFGTGLLLGFLSNSFCVLCALLHGDIKLIWDFSAAMIPVMIYAFIAVFIQCAEEELWCRGFLYERISIHYPLWVAILVNGVLFGLLHIFNEGATVLAIADVAVCGIGYSLLRWYTGSIWTAFGIHTMWNFTQNFIFGLPNSGLVTEASMFHLDAATGISNLMYSYEFGVEGAVPAVFIDALIAVVILVLAYRNGRIKELAFSKEMCGYVEPETWFSRRKKKTDEIAETVEIEEPAEAAESVEAEE